ncbi:hypothetical protein L3X38_039957 [Prunus dulcis]|uniref:Uncharacterized protein n=1 Tax=Prunus dulcis TaxID=3755 RepID=A0AAD4V835_PRUDU|nr:hypothetical protein L3X38_039957 [Prunus dulcis]
MNITSKWDPDSYGENESKSLEALLMASEGELEKSMLTQSTVSKLSRIFPIFGNETDGMEARHLFLGMEMIFLSVGRIGTGNLRMLPLQHRQLLNQQKWHSCQSNRRTSRQFSSKSHDKICLSASSRTSRTSVWANSFQMAD